MLRATSLSVERTATPLDVAVLAHDQRHLRRKVISLASGARVLVDLPEPVHLAHGDRLVLENGRHVEVVAAAEDLMEVRAADARALAALAWHIGNRHLAAQIEPARILVARDRVIRDMLIGLGAAVRHVREPFEPEHGAYAGQSHGQAHGHGHSHGHDGHGH